MITTSDEYFEKVIKQGDMGSGLLGEAIAETIGNSPFVSIEGKPYSLPGLRLPRGMSGVVHSDIGKGSTLEEKVESLVERLTEKAKEIGATPIGFTNIVDSVSGDEAMIRVIRDTLIRVANEKKYVVLNGENAILGNRVVGDANISGTMISMVDPEELIRRGLDSSGIVHTRNRGMYIVFPTNEEFLFMNSDGVGTWHEFVERLGVEFWPRANRNALAMVADDAAKNGGRIVAYSGVYEKNYAAYGIANNVVDEMTRLCKELGFLGILQTRTGNIQSYKEGIFAFNIGGSAVSIIDKNRLNNLPVPVAGNYLVVLKGFRPNPRSNGITAKREGEGKLHGKEWHETEWGKHDMEFLSEPCEIYYGFFKGLFDNGLASSVYHNSGGAFDRKLAGPLAKFGLYAELINLFEPDARDYKLASVTSPTVEAAYRKYPMGNDAFVATDNPKAVIERARRVGLYAQEAGKIEKREDGVTGVGFYAFGQRIYFSGKAA